MFAVIAFNLCDGLEQVEIGQNFGVHPSNMCAQRRHVRYVVSDMCAKREFRSASASAQSDQSLHCPHEETALVA